MWRAAADFNRNRPDAKANSFQAQKDGGSFGHSAYAKLDSELDAGNLGKSKKEVAALLAEGKTLPQINARYSKNTYFTGSAAREQAFIASLSPAQKKVYQAARAEQQARAATLQKAIQAQ